MSQTVLWKMFSKLVNISCSSQDSKEVNVWKKDEAWNFEKICPAEIEKPCPEYEEGTLSGKFQAPFYNPSQALNIFRNKLSNYELSEILLYNYIYYTGTRAKNKPSPAFVSFGVDSSFDDRDGFYRIVEGDHVAYRYELLEQLGEGVFGSVVKAYDHKLSQIVALKIICNAPEKQKQAKEEVKILEFIMKHDPTGSTNAIKVLDNFIFRQHHCIAFELMGESLLDIIEKKAFRGFSINTLRNYAESILQCLSFLHSHGIVHCDLKPDNIMLDKSGRKIKVIDFGLACNEKRPVFSYIQARYYRAPEVMLGKGYGREIDVWSLGCLLAELCTGRPLFQGKDENHQMALVMQTLGVPPKHVFQGGKRSRIFFSSEGHPRYCCSVAMTRDGHLQYFVPSSQPNGTYVGPPRHRSLKSTLKTSGNFVKPDFVDFLKRCLHWDPKERMTADQALMHSWILGSS